MKSSLSTARSRVPADQEDEEESSAPLSRGAGAGGMPAGFPGMGAGGMPDLAGLMSNPAVMQMAQSMMANGGLEGLMNNPYVFFSLQTNHRRTRADLRGLYSMLRNMMNGAGGAGGMPDLNAMMNDPAMRRMAEQFGAGMGGGSTGGRRPPGANDGEDGPDNMYS